jgi:hypothetical protein
VQISVSNNANRISVFHSLSFNHVSEDYPFPDLILLRVLESIEL